jgi:hypothetical protein
MKFLIRLRWLLHILPYFIRDFWINSRPGQERSFWLGFKDSQTGQDVCVLTLAAGKEHCAASREMVKEWRDIQR